MLAVVQRVTEAAVTVEQGSEGGPYRAAIGPGLCVLLGVEVGDDEPAADWIAGKIARLRIFRDQQGKMNRSVQEIGGEVLLISQFTLAGDCAKGNRPSFVRAARGPQSQSIAIGEPHEPAAGEALYQRVAAQLRTTQALPVKTGLFGAMMQVSLVNDGPVTLIVGRPPNG